MSPGTESGRPITSTDECQDCGGTFESAKEMDRIECPECLSRPVQTA